ncbi:MAG: heavy-metal-associated domain-containing protein [Burkholderiales bacterium]
MFQLNVEKTTLKIDGMTCQGCVASITGVLKDVNGVIDAQVSLEANEASVAFDSGETLLAEVKEAIEDAGYEVRSYR